MLQEKRKRQERIRKKERMGLFPRINRDVLAEESWDVELALVRCVFKNAGAELLKTEFALNVVNGIMALCWTLRTWLVLCLHREKRNAEFFLAIGCL